MHDRNKMITRSLNRLENNLPEIRDDIKIRNRILLRVLHRSLLIFRPHQSFLNSRLRGVDRVFKDLKKKIFNN